MNGIQILSEEPIMAYKTNLMILILIIPIFILIFLYFYIGNKIGNWETACGITIIFILLSFAIQVYIWSSGIVSKPSGKYRYTVKISKECSLLEFNKKYKILKVNKDSTYLITDDLDYIGN